MGNHSLEVIYQIWDDGQGTRIELSPDRDGLGSLSEIKKLDGNGVEETTIVMNVDQLKQLQVAIARRLSDIDAYLKANTSGFP